MPASEGVQGPGEMMIAWGASAIASSAVRVSFRWTTGDTPSSPTYCTML